MRSGRLLPHLLPLVPVVLSGCADLQQMMPGASPAPPPVIETAHLHANLTGSAGARLTPQGVPTLLRELRGEGFLQSPGSASTNPLAPCGLLAGALTSGFTNNLFCEMAGVCQLLPTPRGTRILGAYDNELAKSPRAIPRDDPLTTADIMARLYAFRSGGDSLTFNGFIGPRTQQQCLALVASPGRTVRELSPYRGGPMPPDAAPVSAWATRIEQDDANRHDAELKTPGFLDRSATATTNPFAPCSVLRSFRLAARLNDSWPAIAAGKFDSTDVGSLGSLAPYRDDLKNPALLQSGTPRAAEAMAAAFAAEVIRANALTEQLLAKATQQDCSDEILTPGTIRQRLMKQGIILPLR